MDDRHLSYIKKFLKKKSCELQLHSSFQAAFFFLVVRFRLKESDIQSSKKFENKMLLEFSNHQK
jgi:hypothetical protein